MKTATVLTLAGSIFAGAAAFGQEAESPECETMECRVTRMDVSHNATRSKLDY